MLHLETSNLTKPNSNSAHEIAIILYILSNFLIKFEKCCKRILLFRLLLMIHACTEIERLNRSSGMLIIKSPSASTEPTHIHTYTCTHSECSLTFSRGYFSFGRERIHALNICTQSHSTHLTHSQSTFSTLGVSFSW